MSKKTYKNNYEILTNLSIKKLAKLLTELDSFCNACAYGSDCKMDCLEGHLEWLNKNSLKLSKKGNFFD